MVTENATKNRAEPKTDMILTLDYRLLDQGQTWRIKKRVFYQSYEFILDQKSTRLDNRRLCTPEII